jgi:hypothetical protein
MQCPKTLPPPASNGPKQRPCKPVPRPLLAALQVIRRYDLLAVPLVASLKLESGISERQWQVLEVLLRHPGLRVVWGNWSARIDVDNCSGWSLLAALVRQDLGALKQLLQVEGTSADLQRCTHECAQAQAQLQVGRAQCARAHMDAAA